MNNSTQASVRRSLSATELISGLARLDGWSLSGDGADMVIKKCWNWPDFNQSMAFANAVAFLAGQQNHHPELRVQYRQCTVRWRTHDVGGISRDDLDCAALVDALATGRHEPANPVSRLTGTP